MRFELSDLRLLLAVVDAGNIKHGAAGFEIFLPAFSERLRDIEVICHRCEVRFPIKLRGCLSVHILRIQRL